MRTPPRPARAPATPPADGAGRLHPRNRHQGRYDLARLAKSCPALGARIVRTPAGEPSIDFADPLSVRLLNQALLQDQYGIVQWQIPDGYLCPPVPGRADYLHTIADLLAGDHGGEVPRGPGVRVLDIGVGANGIYPLIGQREYGWRFVGSDIDANALAALQCVLQANAMASAIELRRQPNPEALFAGIVLPGERYDLSVCNPPFHGSAAEAGAVARDKWRKLGRPASAAAGSLNFGGRGTELWCRGGEAGFLRRMADESQRFADRIGWFSSLVSRAQTVPPLRQRLQALGARDVRILPMGQGSKLSRCIAWTFLDADRRTGR